MSTQITRGAYALPGTALAFKTGTWRTQRPRHLHSPAPCHGACPAGEDAQAYLALVEEEDFHAAWQTIVQANPIPSVTGRVCHHPCEAACNRGRYDSPIAIHHVERFLGDQALREGWDYPLSPPPAEAPRIGVVGAGPAGLACAYHLIRLGLNVDLFEALPLAGGLLRTAIPEYRLPKDTLDREIERLLATGIRFRPNHRLGRDLSLDELRQDYPALFLGLGTQRSRPWSIDGATPSDLREGLDLLQEYLEMGRIPEWRSVAVIGAGNTAIDLARVLKRAGVEEVHVISHKAIPAPDVPPEDRMPAIEREIRQALEEGVRIHEHRGVQRLLLRGERVIGVEMVHMKKLPDPSGRLRRIAFEGTETLLHVEQVIPAIGQIMDPEGIEPLLNRWGFLGGDRWGAIPDQAGLFTGGDARGDHGMVSEAVGDGRLAAEAIQALLSRRSLEPPEERTPLAFEHLNLHYFEPGQRPEPALLPVEERTGFQEVEGVLARSQVHAEGVRCFSCGECMACDNCWTLCPDSAVLKARERCQDGSHYVFDYDYCKGCGLCAEECPCGYIEMVAEG